MSAQQTQKEKNKKKKKTERLKLWRLYPNSVYRENLETRKHILLKSTRKEMSGCDVSESRHSVWERGTYQESLLPESSIGKTCMFEKHPGDCALGTGRKKSQDLRWEWHCAIWIQSSVLSNSSFIRRSWRCHQEFANSKGVAMFRSLYFILREWEVLTGFQTEQWHVLSFNKKTPPQV